MSWSRAINVYQQLWTTMCNPPNKLLWKKNTSPHYYPWKAQRLMLLEQTTNWWEQLHDCHNERLVLVSNTKRTLTFSWNCPRYLGTVDKARAETSAKLFSWRIHHSHRGPFMCERRSALALITSVTCAAITWRILRAVKWCVPITALQVLSPHWLSMPTTRGNILRKMYCSQTAATNLEYKESPRTFKTLELKKGLPWRHFRWAVGVCPFLSVVVDCLRNCQPGSQTECLHIYINWICYWKKRSHSGLPLSFNNNVIYKQEGALLEASSWLFLN